MKKLFIAAIAMAFISIATAQSGKFIPAMKSALTMLDSAKSTDELQNLSNRFERIAEAEKDQWLPYYYAAYTLLMKSYMDKDIAHIDPLMDKTDGLLGNAETLMPNNSEINTLKAMTTQRRMEVDRSRYMTLGPKSTQYVKAAEQQDSTNPRALMFDAQMTYYTPSAFGGSKDKGLELIKKSIALFDAQKPQNELAPTWGKQHAQSILDRWSKQ